MSLIKSQQTSCAKKTEELAEKIGQNLKGGEVIELTSDLGGGKTTFARGLARGFGSSDHVASPTFTISKIYKNGKKEMHHFDFYRLPEAGLIAHELEEVINDPNCTVVVEWAEVVKHVLPAERLGITINKTSDDARILSFDYPEQLSYLLDGII
jgi:tRNA threonylcarbamoyladenosine biosynthesis protein TsaE